MPLGILVLIFSAPIVNFDFQGFYFCLFSSLWFRTCDIINLVKLKEQILILKAHLRTTE